LKFSLKNLGQVLFSVVAKKTFKKLLTTEMRFDKILNVATKGGAKFGL
jgi:hypothetical protein